MLFAPIPSRFHVIRTNSKQVSCYSLTCTKPTPNFHQVFPNFHKTSAGPKTVKRCRKFRECCIPNFFVLMACRDFLAELEPEQHKLKPREKTARKERIVRLSQNGMRQVDIAQAAGCSKWWVNTVLKEAKRGKEPWYQISVKSSLADLRTVILENNGAGIAGLSSNLLNPSRILNATHEETVSHTYPFPLLDDYASKENRKIRKLGRRWLGYHLGGKKANSYGFVIMNTLLPSDRDGEALLHKELPAVLDTAMYQRHFSTIFQHLQDRKNAAGDKHRLQAKMRDLILLSEQHLEAAQGQAEKKHFGKKKTQPYIKPQKRIIRRANTKEEASAILEIAKAESEVLDKSVEKFCQIYDHVQEVTPTLPNVLLYCADHAKVANRSFGPRTVTCQSQSPQRSRSL
jgi:hypothetical protein